jgi:hypothetical protein
MIWAMVGFGLQLIEQVIKEKKISNVSNCSLIIGFYRFFDLSFQANKDLSLKIFSGIWSKTLTPMLFFPGSIGS